MRSPGCSNGGVNSVVPGEVINLCEYRWPAEWERHAATWLAWPVSEATWPGIFPRIPAAFAALVAAIARFEPVHLLAGGAAVAEQARREVDRACAAAGSRFPVEIIADISVNDSWCRDYGPIFLTGREGTPATGSSVIIDWDYNAWGGKYPPWDQDALVARKVSQRLGLTALQPGLVLEGGAIEGNGAATILVTENCLLNPNHNPGATQASLELALRHWMQAKHVVWLPGHGIVGDDTDGHIDQLARFIDARRVFVAAPDDDDAPEAADLRAGAAVVAQATNAQGESLIPVPLSIPAPKFQQQQRLPASYCNYYLCNGAVIVPMFRDPADGIALQQLQDCYPQRTIVGVDALDLVWGLGSFHCMTQQQPAVTPD